MRHIFLASEASFENPYENIPYEVDYEVIKRVRDITANIINILLGIAALFIVVILFLITVIDLCYMMIPPLRDTFQNRNWDGSVDTGKKFRLVSKDAVSAVRESYIGEDKCLILYFKKRTKTYIIAAIILYLIIAGSSIIVNIVLTLAEGILRRIYGG